MESRNYVKKNEWMAYAVGALGQGMVYGIMSSYISDFYLNVNSMSLLPLAQTAFPQNRYFFLPLSPKNPIMLILHILYIFDYCLGFSLYF